ncbi:uncharacterized protein [Temnothorax nylanderi]|uniref:uncharacterized protein n=1 Tax=Temnothorax nylanderi TaxID=102681 RepID=UPI003A86A3BA
MKENLIKTLASVSTVCTTADIWTHYNRSFFGVTVHWIDCDTLQRKSAALSCCRIQGKHKYDLIASTLESIHIKYKIDLKVCSTTTDNGSNFVKAFTVFAECEGSQTTTILSQNKDDEVVYSSVTDVLNQSEQSENTYSLPPHLRCAAHTLNLVAVHDAESACDDAQYKKIMRSTMAKCSAAWNKASRSTQAAEVVRNKCNLTLIVPNATRWNSTFYAMERIHRIATQAEGLLNEICEQIGVAIFRPAEITFIAEFVQAVQPLANALNILQSELKCFMGILIPTIICLKKKLSEVRQSVKLVVPLVDALLKGIEARFDNLLQREDLILDSIVHPQFRLRWMDSEEKKLRGKALLLDAMQQLDEHASGSSQSETSASVSEDSFFNFKESAPASVSMSSQMDMYLADPSREMSSLKSYPIVKKIFLNTNTALPSSAPVERLFSLGGQVMTARRNRLTDEHFEMLLLLRANRNV